MRRVLSYCFLLFISFSHYTIAQKAQLQLRIETGVHTASIWRVASDTKAKYAVTASEDQTLRIWEIKNGQLLKTVRPFREGGTQGKLFAVDISPDTKTIAAAGKMSPDAESEDWIYLFSRHTGEVIKKIEKVPARVFDLQFSPDGSYLLAALERGKGMAVYEVSTGKMIYRDTNYQGDIYGVDFQLSGHYAATVSFDGFLRIYDVMAFQQGPIVKELIGDNPYSVAFSPNGGQLVIGCLAKPRVLLYNFANGKVSQNQSLDVRRIGGIPGSHLGSVCFSNNGIYIYATGNARNRNDLQIIRKWQTVNGDFAEDIVISTSNTVLHLAPTTDNQLLFATASSQWGILKETGSLLFQSPLMSNDFSGQAQSLGVSEDGQTIKLRLQNNSLSEYTFSLKDYILRPALARDSTSFLPLQPKDVIDDWENSTKPMLSGKLIPLEPNETAYCAAATHRTLKGCVIGTDRFLRYYESNGQVKWQLPTPEVARAVNITRNNKIIVAAYGDGTLRWYRLNDGKELLTVFIHSDQRRWIAWSTEGFYGCSAGGEELVGWQINKGANQATEFFPIAKFRDTYYRPELIRKIIAQIESPTIDPGNTATEIARKTPPVVSVLSPENGAVIEASTLIVSYVIQSDAAVLGIKVLVNGRPISTQRGLKPAKNALTIEVSIPTGDAQVSIIAENQHGASVPATVQVRGITSQNQPLNDQLRMKILAIGVSKYRDKELKLEFAAKDATDFTRLLKQQQGKLYGDVSVKLLTENDATKEQILAGLAWLKTQTRPQDLAVLFMAGHGFNDEKGGFYYLPVEGDVDRLTQTGVFFEEIRQSLAEISGKVVFFIDACHSGNVMGSRNRPADLIRVANISASPENGIVVFTSSTGSQPSFEKQDWGNGAFTKAVVEGMSGRADLFNKGSISIKNLDAYISNRVTELTEGRQLPTTIVPLSIPDFKLAVLK